MMKKVILILTIILPFCLFGQDLAPTQYEFVKSKYGIEPIPSNWATDADVTAAISGNNLISADSVRGIVNDSMLFQKTPSANQYETKSSFAWRFDGAVRTNDVLGIGSVITMPNPGGSAPEFGAINEGQKYGIYTRSGVDNVQKLVYHPDRTERYFSSDLPLAPAGAVNSIFSIENGLPVEYLVTAADTFFKWQPEVLVRTGEGVVTTGNAGQDIINENVLIQTDGTYEVIVSLDINSNDVTNEDVKITGTLGGANINPNGDDTLIRWEQQDSAGTGAGNLSGTGSNQVTPTGRSYYMDLTAGTKNLTLRLSSELNGDQSAFGTTVRIRRVPLQ